MGKISVVLTIHKNNKEGYELKGSYNSFAEFIQSLQDFLSYHFDWFFDWNEGLSNDFSEEDEDASV